VSTWRHDDGSGANLINQTVRTFWSPRTSPSNNAGTEGKPGPVTEAIRRKATAATFDTNVLGTLLSMKHELRVMPAPRQRQASSICHQPWAREARRALPCILPASTRSKD